MLEKERFKVTPAVYLLLRRDDQILMLQRANTGYQDGMYSLIAGHLDGDETATSAMVREATEEANIAVNPSNLVLVHTAHRLGREATGQERIDLFFETKLWQGEIQNMEPRKCDSLTWFPIQKLPKNTIPFIQSVIHHVLQGIPYSEYTTEPN